MKNYTPAILLKSLFILLILFLIQPLVTIAQNVPKPTGWACGECDASAPVGTAIQHKSWCSSYRGGGGGSGTQSTNRPSAGEQRIAKASSFITKGDASYKSGDYKKAIALYRKAYWYDPNDKSLLQKLKNAKERKASQTNYKPPAVAVTVKPPVNSVKEAEYKKALSEIQRLTTFKNNLEKQIGFLDQWKKDLKNLKKGFDKLSDSVSSQMISNLLDLIPAKKIGVTPARIEYLEKTISTAKILNTSSETIINNFKGKETPKSELDILVKTNDIFKNLGSIIEESANFAPNYLKKELEVLGKTMQLEGASVKMLLSTWKKEYANFFIETVSAIGIVYPPLKYAVAGEQFVEQSLFSAIADYSAIQLSLDISKNEKASSYLKVKQQEATKKIEKNEALIKKYQSQKRH